MVATDANLHTGATGIYRVQVQTTVARDTPSAAHTPGWGELSPDRKRAGVYETPTTAAPTGVPEAAVRLVKLSAVLNRVAVALVLVMLGALVLSSVDGLPAYLVGITLLAGGVLVVLLRHVPLLRLLAVVVNAAVLLVAMDAVHLALVA